jgi:hypothetical protein
MLQTCRTQAGEDWATLVPGLLAASERAASQAWLGYTPAALAAQAPAERQPAQPAAPSGEGAGAQQQMSDADIDNGSLYSMIVGHLAGLRQGTARSDAGGSQVLASTDEPAASAAGRAADSASRRQQAAALLTGSSRAVIRCVAVNPSLHQDTSSTHVFLCQG